MIKVFISQPMNGRTDEEIREARNKAIVDIRSKLGTEFEVIDSFFEDYDVEAGAKDRVEGNVDDLAPGYIPIKYLAKSIDLLAEANVVYFTWDYYQARGCRIEYEIASRYGKVVVVQDELEDKTFRIGDN